MEIMVKPNYDQVYNLCKYISIYQYSIDSMYQYSKKIILDNQSLKMDQYPFRPWMINFSTKKVLVYHANYNMLNIAVVDTLL
jgi:hypothetical protein